MPPASDKIISHSTMGGESGRCIIVGFASLSVFLLVAALFADLDHDEGQYVAAVALMRTGLPFRDFLYLQTPLQPVLFAPLAWLCAGWLFPALRIANAVCGVGTAIAIHYSIRGLGGTPRAALLGALCMACCYPFLFAASVARNDALPALLFAMAIGGFILAVGGARCRHGMMVLSGLAMAAAASTKVSYALPCAAAGLFVVRHARRLGPGAILAFGAGGMIGAVPCLVAWWVAPAAARFGILDYSLTAPYQWRLLNGQAYMLHWPLSLARLLRFLAQGAGLVALIGVARDRFAGRRRADLPSDGLVRDFLDMLILTGLIAAWLPRPTYAQYVVPLLPPLFVRFGLLLDRPSWQGRRARLVIAATFIAGVAQPLSSVARTILAGDPPALGAVRDGRAIGRAMRAAHLVGPVVALAPQLSVDSGAPLDARFATGPFVFRTRHLLTQEQETAFHVATIDSFAARFSRDKPDAILTGTEQDASNIAPHGLDEPLAIWARSQGYRPIRLPWGGLTLHIRR